MNVFRAITLVMSAALIAASAEAGKAQANRNALPFRNGQWGVEFLIDSSKAIGFTRHTGAGRALVLRPRISFVGHAIGPDRRYLNSRRREKTSEIGAQIGRRRYRSLPGGAAAFLTLGVTPAWLWTFEQIQIDEHRFTTTFNGASLGAFVEAGSDYFVTPHFSLGVRTDLSFTYHFGREATSSRSHPIFGYTLRKSPGSVVAALYF